MLPGISEEEWYYRIALNFVTGIGPKKTLLLLDFFGSARDVLQAPVKELVKISGITATTAKAIKDKSVLERAEREMHFIRDKQIKPFYYADADYPQRLRVCNDAPVLMYSKGNINFEAAKVVAVIGTRKYSEYGQRVTEELIAGLKDEQDILVVSGLAYGIDAIAHHACVQNGLPTAGVLAHGLDKLYPATNKKLAAQMLDHGGLLTEFPSETLMERTNFPVRNRIVAGLSDVTVVAESDVKGGAMITAYLARSYNREVAAFPGRVHDGRSAGCNDLIRRNIAGLITGADDLQALMGWKKARREKKETPQLQLELLPEEQRVVSLLQAKDSVHADELLHHAGVSSSQLAAVLLQLEMEGLIKALPGKFYRIG
jgi:DNA processing protein